ncbi:hypothetical protein ACN47E_007334 [Coniothyrium glycines]
MSKYAILGATGNCGLSILQLLSKSPDAHINVLVRSRQKLETSFPSLSSQTNITVFEGSISDINTLSACLTGTRAAFLTVAVTENAPDTSIALDTAKAVVSALQDAKSKGNAKPPKLVVLSSASVDKKFWRNVPAFVHNIMWNANAYIYSDLVRAEEYLRRQEDWVDSVFACPGGMTHDVQKGHELSTENQQTFLGWLDLAAGMIEMAEDADGKWNGQRVSVVLKAGQKARFERWAPLILSKGLLSYYVPWLCKWLP